MFSIYKQFVSIKNNKPKYIINKILARTKDLTLSSQKYNKYLDSFSDISQEKIYDRKTDNDLPFISPKRLTDKKQLYKNKKTLTPKMKKEIIKNFNINKNNNSKNKNLSNKTLQDKKIKFFICDFDNITNKKEEKLIDNKNKFCLTQDNFWNFKKKLKYPYEFRKKQENKKDCEDMNKLLFKEENNSKKQIFCLLDSVFTENKKDRNKNNDLIYNENEIFGFKNIYLDYLKEELKSLINKEKQVNMNSKISFNYNNKIYGKIIMEINSVKVEVINKINNNLISTVNIPFNILCIFYLSNVKQLAHIILNIFRNDFFLNKENLSNKEIKNIFEYIITKQILYKNNILTFKNNFEDQDKNNILAEYLNYRNIKYRTNVRYNILALNKKEEVSKKIIFENCTYNNYRNNFGNDLSQNTYNKNVESMKNLFESNINIINLSWITLDKNYVIKITMPYISIKLPNYKKQINYFINKEMLVFLYKNKFKNWNFYISHYLFTLKKFRLCINNILSYYNLYNSLKTKNMNKNRTKFNFSNYKLNATDIENNKNNNNISNINKINNLYNNIFYEKYNLSNLKFEQYESSVNDNEYVFFVSDEEYIHLYKMKSYVLFVYSCSELKNPKIYYFDFSFYQMKILFYKSKYENLTQFLQRLLKINKDKIKICLDYYYFNGFQTMNNKQIDYHFKESYLIENLNKNNLIINTFNKKNSNTISINNNENINKIIEKELIIKVSNPKFISVSIKKNKDKNIENNSFLEENWIKKEGEIGRNLMEQLVENDINNWGTILWQNQDTIAALKYNKGRGSRRSNIFKGKKDFKAVFKKFLKIK